MNKEDIKEINLEVAIKHSKENSLDKILELLSEGELIEIYENYTHKHKDIKKKELLKKLLYLLKKEKDIYNAITILTEEEFDIIKKIIDCGGELRDDYIDLKNIACSRVFGLLYLFNDNGKIYAVIPKEILDIIKNLDIKKLEKKSKENTKILNIASSMINLYGAVEVMHLATYFKKYYKNIEFDIRPIVYGERVNAIRPMTYNEYYYLINDDYFDSEQTYLIEKVIAQEEDEMFDLDYKSISLQELLEYNNIFYYEEIDETIEFKEYLMDNYKVDSEDAQDITEAIVQLLRGDYSTSMYYINEIFSVFDIDLDKNNIDEILYYISKIANNIPLWGNKGWTNKEILLKEIER